MQEHAPRTTRHAAVALAVLAAAAAGCGEKQPGVAPADASARDFAAILFDSAVGTTTDSPAADQRTDRAPDDAGVTPDGSAPDGAAGPDARDTRTADLPTTPQGKFRRLVEDVLELHARRRAECFNAPAPDEVFPFELFSDLFLSLEIGLSSVDEARVRTCLQAAESTPCPDLAAGAALAACANILVGTVPPGGYCIVNEDCQNPGQSRCVPDHERVCGSRCKARPRLGEGCDGSTDCPPDLTCKADKCAARAAEGADCENHDDCGTGLYCQRLSAEEVEGKCRRLSATIACRGNWQCPLEYVCRIPDDAVAGTCAAGRRAGEVCKVRETEQGDCAAGLRCLPEGPGRFVCSPGRDVGQSCKVPAEGPPFDDLCRVGHCGAGEICALDRKKGQPCSNDDPCETGLECLGGTCKPLDVPAGEACGGDDPRNCAWGTFCKHTASDPDGPGTCTPLRKLNETCEQGQCAAPNDCQSGTCKRC